MTLGAASTATVSDAITAAIASEIASVGSMTATYTLGISDSLANLIDGTAINGNVTTAAGDDADIKITITDNSTTITAAKLNLITAATAGTVTLSNSHTITGTGAELKAALETDAVTAAVGTTATVSGAVTVSVANSIAGAGNVEAAFTNGITDELSNLASGGNATSGLSTAAGDDTNVNITISDNSTSMTAADLSAVTTSTTGTVTLTNAQTITGTGAQVKAALITDCLLYTSDAADE